MARRDTLQKRMATGTAAPDSQTERLLRFLDGTPARPGSLQDDGTITLTAGKALSRFPASLVGAAVKRGLVRVSRDAACRTLHLDEAGKAWLRRTGNTPVDAFANQHRQLAAARDPGDPRSTVLVNRAESPLSVLVRLKARDGQPFLTDEEFAAGERLRADFDRGAIMPGIGMRWDGLSASVSGQRGAGPRDLTESAMAARNRVQAALQATGPEFSGLLTDVCCFLKGLEQVERERGWPQRSAKLMVKAGLSVLSRHYAPRA